MIIQTTIKAGQKSTTHLEATKIIKSLREKPTKHTCPNL